MKTILFIANNSTALSGMVFLIEQLKKKYDYIPVLVCEHCFYETEKYHVINLSGPVKHAGGNLTNTISDYYNVGRKKWRKQIYQFFYNYHRMSQEDKKSKEILKDIKADALVVYSDRMGGILQGFLKNAGTIPKIRVPLAKEYDYRKGFSTRYYDCELILSESIWDMNRLMLLINKSWIRCINNESRAFYPLGYTMAGWTKNMISMHPWIGGGGKSTHVMVVSQEEREAALEEVDKPVIVTGLLEDYYVLQDKINRDKTIQALREKYHCRNQIVILSMPQMAEHNEVPWDIHRENMRKFVAMLSEQFGEILVSLHPKSNVDDYKYLAEYGVLFLEERLREVICGADMLICATTSSVRRWADILQIKKVLINLDYLMVPMMDGQVEEIRKDIIDSISGKKAQNREVDVNDIRCVVDEIISIVE